MNTETNNYLFELIKETAVELLKIYFEKSKRKTLLKIPEYRRTENKRISEQELRFVMTNLHGKFAKTNLYYSVETPTSEEYGFSGLGKRSASSDLSFYENDVKVLNMELKAHNPKPIEIKKDIEKLVRENCNGAWIHIFETENRGTVKSLFQKFDLAFENFKNSNRPISFHILILETQTLLSRKWKENESDYSNNIFNIEYSQWKNLKPGVYRYLNGKANLEQKFEYDWQIDKFNIKDGK